MTRPEWVTCIARTHAAHKGASWCGRRIVMEFHFTGLDHAAENGAQQGRLVACPHCLKAATKALRNGLEPEDET